MAVKEVGANWSTDRRLVVNWLIDQPEARDILIATPAPLRRVLEGEFNLEADLVRLDIAEEMVSRWLINRQNPALEFSAATFASPKKAHRMSFIPQFPLTHPTLTLDAIAPGRRRAYSPSVFEFMKIHGRFCAMGGTDVGLYRISKASRLTDEFGADTMLLGLYDTEVVIGSTWNNVIEMGGAAHWRPYPVGRGVEQIAGFWDRYLEIGRCAADPMHRDSRFADRFVANKTHRICQWCGFAQRRVLTARMVFDETWGAVSTD